MKSAQLFNTKTFYNELQMKKFTFGFQYTGDSELLRVTQHDAQMKIHRIRLQSMKWIYVDKPFY